MKLQIALLLTLFLIVSPCQAQSLLGDNTYRQMVLRDFSEKKAVLNNDSVFAVFKEKLTKEEKDALIFLYAYMPLSDLVDYSGDYYRMNVDYALKARKEMSWGKQIPELLFRHFVLPVRVNNEILDVSRKIFYDELRERVKGLSMYNAILEVNHWAHEKVIYTPSDARTSSALASVKTAFGRCGEESTFLVAALRSVGIPARQVYTPRWAHTDDNHAWVEAWADGKWYFLGACEPEPILNLAWFNAPASRGMLMHTKVFGRYNGPEDVMAVTKNTTEINVIDNYAPSDKMVIQVVDKNQLPVLDAKVEFKLYNYAEYYTVASKKTDTKGLTSLSAGKGKMLVWASKGDHFGYSEVFFGKDSQVKIVLNHNPGDIAMLEFNMVPPVEAVSIPPVSEMQRIDNTCRLIKEDSIRNAYTSTFISKEDAEAFAKNTGLSEDVPALLVASRGNHLTLTDFLSAVPESKKTWAIRLLKLISEKDLRDITREVLDDSFSQTGTLPSEYVDMVLNPRVEDEMLVPYKAYLASKVSVEEADNYRKQPRLLVDWCAKEIKLNQEHNAQRIIMSPVGVWNARITDKRSRDVFFVSMARSLGIPAWKDGITGKIKYVDLSTNKAGNIMEVDFETTQPVQSQEGILRLNYRKLSWLDNPKYSIHFTLSKFDKGTFHLLNYDGDWENTFQKGVSVETGYYMLTTGTRLANGGVLSKVTFFNVEARDTTDVELVMREESGEIQVIGSFNSENKYLTLADKTEQSLLKTCGRGYYVVAILGTSQEPTNHALRDIAALGKDFEKWGRQMVFLFPDEQQAKRFNLSEFPGLPSTIHLGIDQDQVVQNEILVNMKLSEAKGLPLFVITDTFNRVVFVSQGYTIGLGEQMMKIIRGL